MPAINTGVYGYPLEPATRVAIETVREFSDDPGSLARVHFACFSQEALAVYDAVLREPM